MLTSYWPLLAGTLCLIGCNSPTLAPEHRVPYFSGEDYEHLDCQQLTNEADRLDIVIAKLSGTKNEPRYVLHADMPFVGTGDNMGAVELLRSKAERAAIQRVYDQKKCSHS